LIARGDVRRQTRSSTEAKDALAAANAQAVEHETSMRRVWT
jgi:hypothetical protein